MRTQTPAALQGMSQEEAWGTLENNMYQTRKFIADLLAGLFVPGENSVLRLAHPVKHDIYLNRNCPK